MCGALPAKTRMPGTQIALKSKSELAALKGRPNMYSMGKTKTTNVWDAPALAIPRVTKSGVRTFSGYAGSSLSD